MLIAVRTSGDHREISVSLQAKIELLRWPLTIAFGGTVSTTLSCSASGIFIICCDHTRPTTTLLARTFKSTRTRRRREQYMPLVAFCLRHFLADFIICMCEFDFRRAQDFTITTSGSRFYTGTCRSTVIEFYD